jgi:soluble lytic murein transglycosylase-like protein
MLPPGPIAVLLVFALVVYAPPGRADLWAYVDQAGKSHFADRQVDARYRLFYKGETTLDAPNGPAAERASAIDALAGTRLYARATDTRLTRRYDALIASHAKANGLDAALVKAVVAVESAFDPLAVSSKGAVGLMQLLPETGERYGLAADARKSVAQQLLDPGTNVRIGTRYLRDLLARFERDTSLALAAGEGNVTARNNSIPPFAETRDYVKLVVHVYALYRPLPAAPASPVRLVKPRPASVAR